MNVLRGLERALGAFKPARLTAHFHPTRVIRVNSKKHPSLVVCPGTAAVPGLDFEPPGNKQIKLGQDLGLE